MIRKIFTGVALLLGTLSAVAQQSPEVIELKRALTLAVENSVQVRQSLLEEKKLKLRQDETKGFGLPGINAAGGLDDYVNIPTTLIPDIFSNPPDPSRMVPVQFGTQYNISAGIEASQILYNQMFLVSLKLARQMIDHGKLQTEQAKTALVLEAGKSFYATQITQIQIRNQRNILSKIEMAEVVAQKQYEMGIIKRTDLDRFTVEKLNLMTELDRLELLYQQSLSLQRYLMGMPQDRMIVFPDSVDVSITPMRQTNLDNHIELRLIDNSRKLAGTDLSLKRAEYFPSLTVIGSTSYMSQSNTFLTDENSEWFNTSLIGLRLNVPVFNGFQKRSRVGQSKVALQQISIQEEDVRKRLEITSADAERKLKMTMVAEQRQRENQALAEKVYNTTQEMYTQGIIPLTDLLNVERALTEAQTYRVAALINMKIAELEYMYANGTLLDLLN